MQFNQFWIGLWAKEAIKSGEPIKLLVYIPYTSSNSFHLSLYCSGFIAALIYGTRNALIAAVALYIVTLAIEVSEAIGQPATNFAIHIWKQTIRG